MLSHIANTVSTNLQVQVEHFSDLFQDKLNCSTDTLVAAFSIFGKNESQKMLLAHIVKLARILSGYKCLKWNGILGDEQLKTLRSSLTTVRRDYLYSANFKYLSIVIEQYSMCIFIGDHSIK